MGHSRAIWKGCSKEELALQIEQCSYEIIERVCTYCEDRMSRFDNTRRMCSSSSGTPRRRSLAGETLVAIWKVYVPERYTTLRFEQDNSSEIAVEGEG